MFNNIKRNSWNRSKNKARQGCRASVPFVYPPRVRGIAFLEVLLDFLGSMSGIESQDAALDESNIAWVAVDRAVLLKSHLAHLQWDRMGLRGKVQVNETHFPTGCLSKA